jgi:nicotinate-nucleotide adenylyltransferase
MAAVNVGVFGGAFDPPHLGHLALAGTAIDHFELDRLLIRVVAEPGHKEVTTDPRIRLHLAELAFAPLEETEVAVDRFARTVDSLEALALPDPVFLIGADEFVSFTRWKEPERVLDLARLGVATRPGYPETALHDVLGRLDRPERVFFFPIEPLPISSSDVRARVAAGGSLDALVPPAVTDEIERLGLYRPG